MKKLIVTVNGVSYEVEVEILEEEDNHDLSIPHTTITQGVAPTSVAPAYVPRPTVTPFSSASDNFVRAPMNGKVIDVKVSQGQQVKSGQIVVELEAMKMKTNIYAPIDGTVKAILVAPGNLVESGQKIIEFE